MKSAGDGRYGGGGATGDAARMDKVREGDSGDKAGEKREKRKIEKKSKKEKENTRGKEIKKRRE